MEPAAIIDTLRAAGVNLKATPEGIIQARPVSNLTGEMAYLIRTNKPALLDYLYQQAANDPGDDLPGSGHDRYAWPNSEAMNSAEIETFAARLCLFAKRGIPMDWADALADKMMKRDREGDDRHACLECQRLAGRTCAAWRQAGIGSAQLPADFMARLQRCPAFTPASLAAQEIPQ